MRIKTCLQLTHLEVSVQRELEAEKKLTQKDPSAYGVGPTRLPKLQTTQLTSEFIHRWFSISFRLHFSVEIYPEGGTPLFGLRGYVSLNRVWPSG